MIVIKNENTPKISQNGIYCIDNINITYLENKEQLYYICKEYYSVTSSIIEIIEEYPNLIISGLIGTQSEQLFGTSEQEYNLNNLADLRNLLNSLNESYSVIHNMNVQASNSQYRNKNSIRLVLYPLTEFCDAKIKRFLRTHIINSILETL